MKKEYFCGGALRGDGYIFTYTGYRTPIEGYSVKL